MTRLEGDESAVQILWMKFADGGEELMREAVVERELWRELNEYWTEFVAETAHLSEELVQQSSAVDELRGVGDGLGQFHGESEGRWCALRPSLPRLGLMLAVET